MSKKKKVVQKENASVTDLPFFFRDKIETLGHISRLSPEYQKAIYKDAARIVHYCQNPVRLWRFQKLSVSEQMELLPGLYRDYGVRSRKRLLNEAKLYMRYYAQQTSTSFLKSIWNRFKKR